MESENLLDTLKSWRRAGTPVLDATPAKAACAHLDRVRAAWHPAVHYDHIQQCQCFIQTHDAVGCTTVAKGRVTSAAVQTATRFGYLQCMAAHTHIHTLSKQIGGADDSAKLTPPSSSAWCIGVQDADVAAVM